jgi:hypothetical protein
MLYVAEQNADSLPTVHIAVYGKILSGTPAEHGLTNTQNMDVLIFLNRPLPRLHRFGNGRFDPVAVGTFSN